MHLTSKYGMMRLLRKAAKNKLLDSQSFFPLAYDLQEKIDSANFIVSFISHLCLKELWAIARSVEEKIDCGIMQDIFQKDKHPNNKRFHLDN